MPISKITVKKGVGLVLDSGGVRLGSEAVAETADGTRLFWSASWKDLRELSEAAVKHCASGERAQVEIAGVRVGVHSAMNATDVRMSLRSKRDAETKVPQK